MSYAGENLRHLDREAEVKKWHNFESLNDNTPAMMAVWAWRWLARRYTDGF